RWSPWRPIFRAWCGAPASPVVQGGGIYLRGGVGGGGDPSGFLAGPGAKGDRPRRPGAGQEGGGEGGSERTFRSPHVRTNQPRRLIGSTAIFVGVSLMELPPDLPVPVDDGAADHLPGSRMPSVRLPSTGGRLVDLGALPTQEIRRFREDPGLPHGLGPRRTVLYCYPRTGRPDRPGQVRWGSLPVLPGGAP